MFVEHFFVFEGLLVCLFVFRDGVLHLDLLLHVGTHNVLLVLVLSLLHGVVLPHELVFVGNLIGDFSFGIPLHVGDVAPHLVLGSNAFVVFGLRLHHHDRVQVLPVLLLLLPVEDLVPLERLVCLIYSLLLLHDLLEFL